MLQERAIKTGRVPAFNKALQTAGVRGYAAKKAKEGTAYLPVKLSNEAALAVIRGAPVWLAHFGATNMEEDLWTTLKEVRRGAQRAGVG